MSRWIQVVAVALAAVVWLVPAFTQVGYSQAVSVQETVQETPIVLPVADEIPDTELALIVGQMWDDNRWGSGGGGGGGVLLWLAAKALEKLAHAVTFAGRGIADVGTKAVHFAGQAATKIGELTMRGARWVGVQATQHPFVKDTLVGMTGGVTGEAVKAKFVDNRPLTLKDVGFGLVWGGMFGAFGYAIDSTLDKLEQRGP